MVSTLMGGAYLREQKEKIQNNIENELPVKYLDNRSH